MLLGPACRTICSPLLNVECSQYRDGRAESRTRVPRDIKHYTPKFANITLQKSRHGRARSHPAGKRRLPLSTVFLFVDRWFARVLFAHGGRGLPGSRNEEYTNDTKDPMHRQAETKAKLHFPYAGRLTGTQKNKKTRRTLFDAVSSPSRNDSIQKKHTHTHDIRAD